MTRQPKPGYARAPSRGRTLQRGLVFGAGMASLVPADTARSEQDMPLDAAKTQRTMVAAYPSIEPLAFDKQEHFFVSAKLLRLTDIGKTEYGTALIAAEQVRYRGIEKEMHDVNMTKVEIDQHRLNLISRQKIETICMIDDLIVDLGLETPALSNHLTDRLGSFDPHKVAGRDSNYARNYLTFYGKVMLEWYGGERCWFIEALEKQGLTAAQISAHPLVQAFDTLVDLSRKEDRLIYSLDLDQGDLMSDLHGILQGLQVGVRREAAFMRALDARGEQSGESVREFYNRFLTDDPFMQALHDLPYGIANGIITTDYFIQRYVYAVRSNLPQEPHTILANDRVSMTYHPIKGEPWMGVVSTTVKVSPYAAGQLAKNLFDPLARDPAHPDGQQEAMQQVYAESAGAYQDAVAKSGVLATSAKLLATAQPDPRP